MYILGYSGDRCEFSGSCGEKDCFTGSCIKTHQGYQCKCPKSYTGDRCQTSRSYFCSQIF